MDASVCRMESSPLDVLDHAAQGLTQHEPIAAVS